MAQAGIHDMVGMAVGKWTPDGAFYHLSLSLAFGVTILMRETVEAVSF
jgi:hypothetical protein